MSGSLTDFLLARIAEDERVANEARPDEYLRTRDASELSRGGELYSFVTITSSRVLAECEAKRMIVTYLGGDRAGVGDPLHPILRTLALPYDSHPDYQQDWKP